MKDTSADAAFTALFAARSGSDRVRMACGMFDAAKALMAAGIRSQCPGISAADLRLRMFDRLYSGDFDPDTRVRIRSALQDASVDPP
jgi:hypothetical protein